MKPLVRSPDDVKPLRADAQRNRDALLASARAAFNAGELELRIEEIARRASVGVGTLYRHFDTRDDLIEAVYRQEVAALCASAGELLRTLPAGRALHTFLRQIVSHASENRGLATALTAVMTSSSPAYAHGNQQLLTTLVVLMDAAATAGQIRTDVTPSTLLMAMSGICGAHNQPGWDEQAWEVVELLMNGLRFGVVGSKTS